MGALEEAEDIQVGEHLLTDDEYFAQMAVLEDELIDDYLGGRLSVADRALFEDHFLLSRSHQDKLRFARSLRKYVKQQAGVAKPAHGSRPFLLLSFRVALTTAAMILVLLTGYRVFIHKSDLEKAQDLLNHLYKNERPVKSRIATLDWAPFVETRAGQNDPTGKDKLAAESVSILLAQALRDEPGPAAEHAFGEFSLANGNFDEAITHLSLAVEGDPAKAVYRSDLGAAWLEKGKYDRAHGKESEGLEELKRSLEELDRVLSRDASFKPALFNQALCLEALEQWRQAESAWENYLAKDPDSRWAADAKMSLDLVKQK